MLRRSMLAGALGVPFVGAPLQALAQAADPPDADDFFGLPTTVGATLSPSGRKIAILKQKVDETAKDKDGKPKRGWISYVSVADVTNLDRPSNYQLPGDLSVEAILWKSDSHLLVRMLAGTIIWMPQGIIMPVRRLGVLGADGKSFRILLDEDQRVKEACPDLSVVVDLMAGDPRNILMQHTDVDRAVESLFKVDVVTGAKTLVERGTSFTRTWHTQNGVPMVRIDANLNDTVHTYLGRAPGETQWKRIRQVRNSEWVRLNTGFEIVGETPDAGVLLAAVMTEQDQNLTLRKFDIRTLGFGEVVSQRAGEDAVGALSDVRGQYVAARYQHDKVGYDFVDPAMGEHFKELEAVFQGRKNVEIVDMSADRGSWLVLVSGPQDPGSFVYFDRINGKLGLLGARQPWLSEQRLGRTEMLDVKTRDGTTIRAYLTGPPAGAAARPMVVMPHGGPEARDIFGFDPFVQLLAGQGWLVLQPNFRGSSGYGRAFADAGRKQFNGKVMEDVEDAVDQVVASGRADVKRLAVCGMSFGGYAALMSAIRRPEAYRAIVSIAGVSDWLDFVNSEKNEPLAFEYWQRTAGDLRADSVVLTACSPQRRAAEIKAPVLLVHGRADPIVRVQQSKDMTAALRRAGKTVEYEELPYAGHNLDLDSGPKIMKRTLDFLKPKLA